MHFHVDSTHEVVDMYGDVVVESLLESNVEQGTKLGAATGQDSTKIVSEFSGHEVSCMLRDTDSDASTMLMTEFSMELEVFQKLLNKQGIVSCKDKCSSVRCKGIMNNQPWLRIELDAIEPRVNRRILTSTVNAVDGEGRPKVYYHGAYGRYVLSIVLNRKLKLGTVETGKSGAGV